MDYRNPSAIFALVLTVCFLLLFLVIIGKIYTNTIDLSTLLSEPGAEGKSSLSRFQLLVFTLVIAGLYVILSIENGQLINVPEGALVLLGISGGTYAISKGLSNAEKDGGARRSNLDQTQRGATGQEKDGDDRAAQPAGRFTKVPE